MVVSLVLAVKMAYYQYSAFFIAWPKLGTPVTLNVSIGSLVRNTARENRKYKRGTDRGTGKGFSQGRTLVTLPTK